MATARSARSAPRVERSLHRAGDRIGRSPAARAARAGNDLVLLHLERGVYFTLNETGAFIWEQIGDGAALGELCGAVVERFAVDEAQAWRDLVALIGELAADQLVVVEEAPTESG